MSGAELTTALLSIQTKLAACGEGFIIRNTLRHQAMQLAASFVDPGWEEAPAPPLRDGKAMAAEIDDYCGF